MGVNFVRNEIQDGGKSFSHEDLADGEAVLDDDLGALFVKTDEGWAVFYKDSDGVIAFDTSNCWIGIKVKVVEVSYK